MGRSARHLPRPFQTNAGDLIRCYQCLGQVPTHSVRQPCIQPSVSPVECADFCHAARRARGRSWCACGVVSRARGRLRRGQQGREPRQPSKARARQLHTNGVHLRGNSRGGAVEWAYPGHQTSVKKSLLLSSHLRGLNCCAWAMGRLTTSATAVIHRVPQLKTR